ncbi:hypothetical protein [Segnochrobactrum spirostomi]|uniref:Uncharacterized protein n=1 Tax=Segnochrobactrum spirostomi TaxID=2608987 RepID=A0A6A7Y354_9HYPH|nr:hypothetical protein [Segnochrobactrum spirostomi]MQT13145.1 hypothetical protein [Segnochrobactrum spirostomi]
MTEQRAVAASTAPIATEATTPSVGLKPNALTAETLAKSERGEDLRRFADPDAMFKELGI